MQFQFDGNQSFQVRAIEAVAELFQGQARLTDDLSGVSFEDLIGPVANRLALDEAQLLRNLRAVQERNRLKPDDALQCIEEPIDARNGPKTARFPNYSVEMETGTGKTYVYLRTALELHRRYGLRKYIVVVPSVAVREGVLKTLKITEKHLRELYGNVAYRSTVYDSRNITRVRQFAQSDCIEIMVMTIDSFSKKENVIRESTDRLQGATPIYLVQSARPVLILDEPQNMESEGRIRALASLDPLFALRYSATHRNPYNLVYRLTPFEAYRQGLVKHIEVASVVKEDDFNQVFLRLVEIRSDRKTVQARIALHKRMADGTIREKIYLFNPGDNLAKRAERPEYASFQIDEINPGGGTVRFTNDVELQEGQSRGADQDVLFREQIRYTVGEHLRKQAKLKAAGIKVLSLFFIDRVENYTAADGLIRRLFDEAFEELKGKYPDWAGLKPEEVRAAYFAQKTRRGGTVEAVDSTTGRNEDDRAAYNLIMKDKEKLLSFRDSPVAFIFSHSALREGWDNPNVCQICTLNQTVSEVKKRQEVGRGMRLAVNQKGERIFDEKVNVLTVVANESYERYVEGLQAEMVEAFGADGAAPRPVNARKKQTVRRRPLAEFPPEFVALWERIKHKTRYRVTIDTAQLVRDVAAALEKVQVDPPRVVVVKAAVHAPADRDVLEARQLTAATTRAVLTGRTTPPNLIEMMGELMEHTTPPLRLTRRTLLEVLRRLSTERQQAALNNPQDFTTKAVQIIREQAVRQLVAGIQYDKMAEWYEMSQWEEEQESSTDKLVPVTRSIYDHVVYQSGTEKDFVEALDKRLDAVRLFVKLPAWFKVSTPVGNYNPDWAIVMEQRDEFGDAADKPLLYLVRETKSTVTESQLREEEQHKIHCGERHFKGALGVDYKVVTSADDLP